MKISVIVFYCFVLILSTKFNSYYKTVAMLIDIHFIEYLTVLNSGFEATVIPLGFNIDI